VPPSGLGQVAPSSTPSRQGSPKYLLLSPWCCRLDGRISLVLLYYSEAIHTHSRSTCSASHRDLACSHRIGGPTRTFSLYPLPRSASPLGKTCRWKGLTQLADVYVTDTRKSKPSNTHGVIFKNWPKNLHSVVVLCFFTSPRTPCNKIAPVLRTTKWNFVLGTHYGYLPRIL
jgi:hypothetical protein